MAYNGFPVGGHGNSAIDPNELNMPGNYHQQSYQANHMGHNSNPSNVFSSGSAILGDDELLEGLGSPTEQPMHGQNFGGGMNEMNMSYQPVYGSPHHGLMDQNYGNGFSSTPDGDVPAPSPWVSNFGQYRQMQHPQTFAGSLQSPLSYAGSPLGNDMNNDGTKGRARVAQAMQAKTAPGRSPLPQKPTAMAGLSINSEANFGAQPIRGTGGHHEKSLSGQWAQTPNSLSSFPGSYPSPLGSGNLHGPANLDLMLKAGTSMPAKLGTTAPVSSQEAKRKRRRESHNLVERRRRDNINERIQDLSKLVPGHRLEDEKIRKAIQNGTPLSPTLPGIPSPNQATSSLAGPGARRAAGGTAGNITTGLPIEEKDKGPNKGDILNGAVSWTRDLMWMLHLKLQQQEELINTIIELGGKIPFEFTEDERRMQTELMEAVSRNEEGNPRQFSYSRFAGSGLRVPHHTDYKGEPLNGQPNGQSGDHVTISPGQGNGEFDNEFVDYDDDDFKEEDEYNMDMT
ncbi:microphthalmia-associated transcription factor [Rhypophila sp. PSN 637]